MTRTRWSADEGLFHVRTASVTETDFVEADPAGVVVVVNYAKGGCSLREAQPAPASVSAPSVAGSRQD